jgi:hypothetical protein
MRGLVLRLGLIIGMGTAVLATDSGPAAAAPRRNCGACATLDLCTAEWCSLICGGIGSGAYCEESTACGHLPNVWLDCGAVS